MSEYKFYVKVNDMQLSRATGWLSYVSPQASPDLKSLGDCPFTQRANLALKIKKVTSTYILVNLYDKPKWYLKVNQAGSVPTLEFGDRTITDSYEIVQYLDATYPNPPLKPEGNEEAEKVTGNIFNLFGAWAKHSKDPASAEAEKAFTAELQKINDFMGERPGPFLCGSGWSVADCALVPRLYHISAVAEHFLHYTKHKDMPHLQNYMQHTFNTDEFKATDYPSEWILTGWAKYF